MEALTCNAHIHTPHSFSAFDSVAEIVDRARAESIACLGINDFNTIAGFSEFAGACGRNGVYPLFNIEFISLVRGDKLAGLRWNDPKNPGIMYFCGKALDEPHRIPAKVNAALRDLRAGTQDHIRRVIERLNDFVAERGLSLRFDYDVIRARFANEAVRERHVAKAVYFAMLETYPDAAPRQAAYAGLFGESRYSPPDDFAEAQNDIRSRLLKAGRPAFVEENAEAFLAPEQVHALTLEAGGVPCYPVFADDSGSIPERERNVDVLADTLEAMRVYAVEFIPSRNTFDHLKRYASRLAERGFVVVFGTEHNTPAIEPLTPAARNGVPFDGELRRLAYRGACILAAHQELRRSKGEGYVRRDGSRAVDRSELEDLARFGDAAIRRANGKVRA